MKKYSVLILMLGDLASISLITVIGFVTHNEAGFGALPRMLTTFLPLTLSWCLAAWGLGLYVPSITGKWSQLWRPVLAALLAGPLAAVGRAFMLNSVVIPLFALVLSATTALGMLVWRTAWRAVIGRQVK